MNTQSKARSSLLVVAVATILSGCASTDTINELETARTVVAQVEASPRAGVAAANISEARKALDRANSAAADGKKGDAKYFANVAAVQGQIANEKILTAQAQEAVQQGTVERQRVLAEARALEAERANQRADSLKAQTENLEQQLKDLQTKRTERGLVLTLGDVLFDTGKASLKPGAYATIDRLATALREVPARAVVIEGHTDSVGSEQYNQSLSEQRAMAVQSALLQRGVNGQQIRTAGMGEGLPVAGNDSPSGRQQKRCVEVILTETTPRVATDTN